VSGFPVTKNYIFFLYKMSSPLTPPDEPQFNEIEITVTRWVMFVTTTLGTIGAIYIIGTFVIYIIEDKEINVGVKCQLTIYAVSGWGLKGLSAFPQRYIVYPRSLPRSHFDV
jgi:hypothetical protein